jgi:hypothetical protein
MSELFARFGRKAKKKTSPRRSRQSLRVESLEQRQMMSATSPAAPVAPLTSVPATFAPAIYSGPQPLVSAVEQQAMAALSAVKNVPYVPPANCVTLSINSTNVKTASATFNYAGPPCTVTSWGSPVRNGSVIDIKINMQIPAGPIPLMLQFQSHQYSLGSLKPGMYTLRVFVSDSLVKNTQFAGNLILL